MNLDVLMYKMGISLACKAMVKINYYLVIYAEHPGHNRYIIKAAIIFTSCHLECSCIVIQSTPLYLWLMERHTLFSHLWRIYFSFRLPYPNPWSVFLGLLHRKLISPGTPSNTTSSREPSLTPTTLCIYPDITFSPQGPASSTEEML